MNQKDYQKPTMKVVELQPRKMLMTSEVTTGTSAKRSGYGTASTEDGTWQTWE